DATVTGVQTCALPICIPNGAHFYFVHSYYPDLGEGAGVATAGGPAPHTKLAWCEYGVRFAAAVQHGRVHATQFHPEKSQRWGLRSEERRVGKGGSGRG